MSYLHIIVPYNDNVKNDNRHENLELIDNRSQHTILHRANTRLWKGDRKCID